MYDAGHAHTYKALREFRKDGNLSRGSRCLERERSRDVRFRTFFFVFLRERFAYITTRRRSSTFVVCGGQSARHDYSELHRFKVLSNNIPSVYLYESREPLAGNNLFGAVCFYPVE